jgi:photosystem II stability/assembly factor-like uncharacterized protein
MREREWAPLRANKSFDMRVTILFTLLACLFQTGTAQEWVRQHPFAGFAPLHDITFDDQGNGWAVGQQSLILHSSDWGNTWKIQRGLPIGYSFQTVEIVPGTNAQTVLVGGPGVFITTDGGQHWSFASLPQQIDAVNRVQAFDPQRWVVIGISRGATTDDGGQTWTIYDMPDPSTNSGWFTDLNTGWVGSGNFNNQQVFKTTDGGMTWDLANDDLYPVITDLMMLNDQIGFLSGRDHIYKTNNGGSDWIKLHDDVQPSLTGMHVVSEQIIWSGLNNGFVFYTLDGGDNWTQTNPEVISGNSIDGIYATADGRVWAPGKFASISHTMDAGQNWYDQTPGKKNTLHDIQFDGETGFAVGYGLILRTNNNGVIWEDIINDEEEYGALAIIEEMGTRHVFTGTWSGRVLHSSNDGDDWTVVGENLNRIYTIYAHSTQELLVGASTGISRSTNGGQSWSFVANTSNHVSEI